jgi:type I restriction enzyme S subunit
MKNGDASIVGREELPNGWATARLNEIAALNPRHSRDVDNKQAVTFVPMPAVSETSPLLDTAQERALESVRTGYTHFAEGDVLFAKITPCMENGKGAVATGLRNGLGCGTTELHVVRPHAGIHPHYIYRFLAQRSVRRAAKENFTGSAGQARVPMSFMEELEIPVPPTNEQRRIVAKLETLLGKVDACQRRLAKIPHLLKRFRQSVLAAACSGRLTADWRAQNSASSAAPREKSGSRGGAENAEDLPETWTLVVLDTLLQQSREISYGIVKPGVHDPNGVRLLKSQQVRDGTMDLSADFRITKKLDKEYARTRLQGGEILLNLVGASIGRSAIAPAELRGVNVSRAIAVIPVVHEMTPWVQWNLRGPVGQKLIQSKTGGSAQPVLNLSEVRTLTIPVPALPEQHEIVRRVEQLFTFADQLEARFAKAQAHVDKLTPSLLAKAFRGELVPQDPNDEPASTLLARIGSGATSKENRRAKTSGLRK